MVSNLNRLKMRNFAYKKNKIFKKALALFETEKSKYNL